MLRSRWIYAKWSVVGAALVMALGLIGIYYASAQSPQPPPFHGVIQFQDRSVCFYVSPFFGKDVVPIVTHVDDTGVPVGRFGGSSIDLGAYSFSTVDVTQTQVPGKLRVVCEGLVFDHTLIQADADSGQVNIALPNHQPVVTNFVARLNGQAVRGVPGGSTVTVSVSATDPDGDPLHYAWGATDGTATNADAPQATWTLPNSRGLHFLYVLVSDGKGGYQERQLALSTDGAIVPNLDTFRVFLPVISSQQSGQHVASFLLDLKPSEHTPAGSHFLTYSELGFAGGYPYVFQSNRLSACAYYRDLGVVGGCTSDGHPTGMQLTFTDWKQYWGFGLPSSNEVSAKYANLADLNLQRDMHTLSRPGPRPSGGTGTDVASYVCNYPNTDATLSNVRLGNNLVACVAFEYTVTNNPTTGQPYNNGQPFTKFLTFGPTGDLLFSVNLDGRGEKFIPGACVACHGGFAYRGYDPSGTPNPALGSQFIPYDLDNYAYADLPGFRREDQEVSLHALNKFVKDTNPNQSIVELINGWYPTPTSNFNGNFVPTGWQGHETLYLDVVKPSCRMCHVALLEGRNTFNTAAGFASFSWHIANYVCGATKPASVAGNYWYTMPNARQTFDRFWQGIPGTTAVDQPAKLLQFLIEQGTTDIDGAPVTSCELPTWLP